MSSRKFLWLCLAIGLLALGLAVASPSPWRLQGYMQFGPVWAALSLLAAGIVGLLAWGQLPADRSRRLDAAVALVLALGIVWLVPGRSLIENDESSMQAAALRLAHDFSPVLAADGIVAEDGTVHVLAQSLDKRGILFPLLLALPTRVLGADAGHAIAGNALFLLGVLFLVQRLARRFGLRALTFTVPLLLLSFPAFTVTARSGTFDLANAFFLLWAIHAAAGFPTRPAPGRAVQVLAAATSASQLRYESILLAAILLASLLWTVWRKALIDRRRFAWLALAPLALVVPAMRMAVPFDYEMPAPWFDPWGLRNAPDNLERLLAWLLTPAGTHLGSPVVGLLAAIMVVVLLVACRRCWRTWLRPTTGIPVLLLLVQTAVFMLSWWGQATLVVTTRYFLAVAIAAALLAAALLQRLSGGLGNAHSAALAAVLAAIPLALQFQALRQAEPFLALLDQHGREQTLALLRSHYGSCNVLVLSTDSVVFLARGYSAAHPRLYRDSGLELLQRISEHSIAAVVFRVPTAEGRVQMAADLLAQWPARITWQSPDAGAGVRLLQVWPEHEVVQSECRRRGAPVGFRLHPEFPRRNWEHFVPRWSAADPALRELLGKPPGSDQ